MGHTVSLYALIENGTPTTLQAFLPDSARRQDTQEWVLGLSAASVALREATGWFAVTEVARPADTATHTTDRRIQLVGGTWTVVWTSRPKTAEELTMATAATNSSAITTNLLQDMTEIQAIIDSTNATINSNPAAAIKTICRAQRRIIRKLLSLYDGTT